VRGLSRALTVERLAVQAQELRSGADFSSLLGVLRRGCAALEFDFKKRTNSGKFAPSGQCCIYVFMFAVRQTRDPSRLGSRGARYDGGKTQSASKGFARRPRRSCG